MNFLRVKVLSMWAVIPERYNLYVRRMSLSRELQRVKLTPLSLYSLSLAVRPPWFCLSSYLKAAQWHWRLFSRRCFLLCGLGSFGSCVCSLSVLIGHRININIPLISLYLFYSSSLHMLIKLLSTLPPSVPLCLCL